MKYRFGRSIFFLLRNAGEEGRSGPAAPGPMTLKILTSLLRQYCGHDMLPNPDAIGQDLQRGVATHRGKGVYLNYIFGHRFFPNVPVWFLRR